MAQKRFILIKLYALPDPAVIDLPATDADKDADGGEETKNAEEEPADSDHDLSNDDS